MMNRLHSVEKRSSPTPDEMNDCKFSAAHTSVIPKVEAEAGELLGVSGLDQLLYENEKKETKIFQFFTT